MCVGVFEECTPHSYFIIEQNLFTCSFIVNYLYICLSELIRHSFPDLLVLVIDSSASMRPSVGKTDEVKVKYSDVLKHHGTHKKKNTFCWLKWYFFAFQNAMFLREFTEGDLLVIALKWEIRVSCSLNHEHFCHSFCSCPQNLPAVNLRKSLSPTFAQGRV